MLALIVSFKHAVTRQDSQLGNLIVSLRTKLMPQQSFQDRGSIQASNRMILLSAEAIYVFQYLALMREPAHDYLSNMLNYI